MQSDLRPAHGRAQMQLLVVSEVALPREVSHPSVRRAASLAKQNAPARVAGGRRPARSMPHVRLGAAEETKGGRGGEGLRLERRGWRQARTDGLAGDFVWTHLLCRRSGAPIVGKS